MTRGRNLCSTKADFTSFIWTSSF